MPNRTVFFVSDGTGITAETFGNSILAQFPTKPRHVRRPFIDTVDKAAAVVREINAGGRARGQAADRLHHAGRRRGARRSSPATPARAWCWTCSAPSSSRWRRSSASSPTTASAASPTPPRARSTTTASRRSTSRWRTTTASRRATSSSADVILVGVSRSGKTPTSLYLAMQHGIKAANYPLIPEDFERGQLPQSLAPHKRKCFGLTIDPERLAQIRNERRPDSSYASLENCRYEVQRGRGDDAPRGHRLAVARRTSRSRRSPPRSCATSGRTG